MSDLVQRLRSVDVSWSETGEWCAEAADRIEALQAENAKLQEAIKRQAAAVRTLHHNEQTEINVLRKKSTEAHRAVATLDSEREMNALLTEENEALQADLAAAERERDKLAEQIEEMEYRAKGNAEAAQYQTDLLASVTEQRNAAKADLAAAEQRGYLRGLEEGKDALAARGLCVVPVVPTEAMLEAALFANENALLSAASCTDIRNAYAAMLTAAQRGV